MTTYYTNEAAFALPDAGFVDRTTHSLELPLPGGRALRLLVARLPVRPGQAFAEAVAEQVKRQTTRVPGYAVTDRRDGEVAGCAAVVLRARWRTDEVPFYERQAHLHAAHATRMLIALTGPAEEAAACDAHFERILGTLKLRDAA